MLSNSPMNIDEEEEGSSEELETYINKIISYAIPKALTLSEVMEASEKDNILLEVVDCLKKNEWSKKEVLNPYKHVKHELMYKGGLLLKGENIVIPSNLRDRTLKIAH